MYKNWKSCVKVDNKLTEFFECNLGVKQGDNLSPALFNIYINDMVNIFDDKFSPNVGEILTICRRPGLIITLKR